MCIRDRSGTINIIAEYESEGFFNRIMGQSRTANNLTRQIINIAEIAIKKSFRQDVYKRQAIIIIEFKGYE